jgi:hypothetical protein
VNRAAVFEHLGRLARAAPGAFRNDTVFRFAAIGAVVALLMLAGRLGGHTGSVAGPTPPPAPRSLGARYGDQAGEAAPPLAAGGPVTPSRSLQGVTISKDSSAPPDRFGTIDAAQPQRKPANDQP